MYSKSFLFLFALLFSLYGCQALLPDAHKYEVSQGNRIEQKQLDQLKIGLSKDQVLYVLGRSLLTPQDEADKWVYLYYTTPAGVEPEKIHTLELLFESGKLKEMHQQDR